MHPEALLEYALFQLTPTRTRCDLVVCLGGKKEKIASGLVEPFISHLKFAKDQIPKGGYSITLRPPSSDASWFTKATFQRFVRFVSTPEVLERFVRVEREIQQIESSIESNELPNTNVAAQVSDGGLSAVDGIIRKSTDSTKSKGETERSDDVLPEENSKIRLQRVLGTRKVLLRKEQAMAYARALAAGFEMDNIDDLISFADSFGASRLREACIDFKDLCKQKNSDRLWMEELAAVKACAPSELSYSGTSGIILACESGPSSQTNMLNFHSDGASTGKLVPNGSLDASSDSTASPANSESYKVQISSTPAPVQMPWTNQIPQFMYSNQSTVQQMPPYQAYPFPGMMPIPPYYQGNMVWPPNVDESNHRNPKPTSRKKEKSHGVKSPNTTEEDELSESGDSNSRSDSDATHTKSHIKKHRKSSKTVVIRNINYITSKKRNEEKNGVSDDQFSTEDELLDEDFLKQKVNDAVASLERHRKSSSHHDKRRGEHKSSSNFSGPDESDPLANKSTEGKRNENWDAFQDILMKNESNANGIEKENTYDEHFAMNSSVDLGSEKVMVKRKVATDSFVVTERNGGYESRVDLEDFGNGENIRASMKNRDCGDEQLLFPQRSQNSESFQEKTVLDCSTDSSMIKNGKGEDWFIVESHGKSNGQIVFDGDYSLSLEHERTQSEKSKKVVPIDDSFMIQARSSIDDQYDSQWRTDISMVSGLSLASEPFNGSIDLSKDKVGLSGAGEPDDLCVVFERDAGLGPVMASWTPEMDFETEVSFKETEKKISVVEIKDQVEEKPLMKIKATNGKTPGKEARSKTLRGSLAKSSSDILSKSKKPSPASRPVVHKSKLEKEEEMRKKMEELVIQRQKRIAERTAARGVSPASPKKVPVGSKTASLRNEKHKP